MLLRRVMKHVRDQNWLAVGIDFLIVVAGVFIGLQVTNWNGERVPRSDEAGYLARLAADLRQDISTFDFFLEIYLIKQETILALREGPLDAVIAGDLKDAALRLEYSLYKAIPAQRRATLDELVQSGNLGVLSNRALVNRLTAYCGRHNRKRIEFEIAREQVGPLLAYLRDPEGKDPGAFHPQSGEPDFTVAGAVRMSAVRQQRQSRYGKGRNDRETSGPNRSSQPAWQANLELGSRLPSSRPG